MDICVSVGVCDRGSVAVSSCCIRVCLVKFIWKCAIDNAIYNLLPE